MRPPRFTNRLLGAAELTARKVAKDVLHDPQQLLAEELIGFAMYLESLVSWKREQNSRLRERQNSRPQVLRRDSSRPGDE